MDQGHPAQEGPAGPGPEIPLAVPGPLVHVHPAGHRHVLQADGAGTAVVPDPAGPDDGDVHVRVRRPGRDLHRRGAAAAVLPVRRDAVELLQRLVQRVVQRVHQQRVRIREGVFPAARGAAGRADVQPHQDGHPADPVPPGVCRLSDRGRAAAGQCDLAAVPVLCAAAGRARDVLGPDRILGHVQVPRPAVPGLLRPPALHVRDAGHLPAERRLRKVQVRAGTEPVDPDLRGLQVRLPGLRILLRGRAAVQHDLHACHPVPGGHRLQPRGTQFHGHRMNAIEFDQVGKLYRLGQVGTGTLSHDLNRWWQTRILGREDPYLRVGETNDRARKGNSDFVWALRDISFNVAEGEVVGIIGKNGAGKSTLLKLLSCVTAPTTGEIRTRGRIASLLEVGTGFHQEMTGRENIFMNGTIMGMTRAEINAKLDAIVDFAGVERYLDTPVKRYSSGMTVRLGFAVAAFLEPEILVVDEVLAVGDAEFQKKAIGKMQDVSRGEGRTVLFVSHNMASVRQLCNSGLLLENGQIAFRGNILETIAKYIEPNPQTTSTSLAKRIDRIGNGKIRLLSIVFRNAHNNPVESVFSGDYLKIDFHIDIQSDVELGQLRVGCAFEDDFQNYSTQWASDEMSQDFSRIKNGRFSLEIPQLNLRPNTYYLYVQISLCSTHPADFCDVVHRAAVIQVASAPFFNSSLLVKPNRGHMALLDANFII